MDWERDGLTRRSALDARLRRRRPRLLVRLRQAGASVRAQDERGARASQSGPFEPFQRDLPMPPVARPVAQSRTLQQYVMTMKPGTADILPGLQDADPRLRRALPGPTIKATRGRAVDIRQRNASGRSLNVHLHGGVTRPEFDGHPHDAIPDGTERLYKYPNVQRAATLWYHDHAHGETAKTLFAGLAGFYLIDDPAEAELELPQGEYDIPLIDPGPQLQRRRLLPLAARRRPRRSAATRSSSTAPSRRG